MQWHALCLCWLIAQALEVNTPGGKLNRGLSVIDTVQILKGRELDDQEYFKAGLLGWCIELVSHFSSTYSLNSSSLTSADQFSFGVLCKRHVNSYSYKLIS